MQYFLPTVLTFTTMAYTTSGRIQPGQSKEEFAAQQNERNFYGQAMEDKKANNLEEMMAHDNGHVDKYNGPKTPPTVGGHPGSRPGYPTSSGSQDTDQLVGGHPGSRPGYQTSSGSQDTEELLSTPEIKELLSSPEFKQLISSPVFQEKMSQFTTKLMESTNHYDMTGGYVLPKELDHEDHFPVLQDKGGDDNNPNLRGIYTEHYPAHDYHSQASAADVSDSDDMYY